jgi:type I restriction enzyme S subunit
MQHPQCEPHATDLPEGWGWAVFGEIVENFDGKRVPVKAADRARRQGSYPYYGASGIIDSIDDYLFDGDFLLVAEDGANLLSRSTAIAFQASGRFWVNNHAHVVQTIGDISSGYLEQYLGGLDLQAYVTGSAQPKLTQASLNRIPVPLAPLGEQKRIVAKVAALHAKANAARKRLAKVLTILKRFRQSVLAAACSGRLTADWRENHPGQEARPEEGETGDFVLPERWKWVRFGKLLRSLRSGSTVPPRSEPTAFPILRSSSIRPGFVDLADTKYLLAKESENQENYLAEGDLLFTRLSGSLDFVGNCALVPALGERRIQYPDRLFCGKLKAPGLGQYFVYAFTAPFVRDELTEGAKSSAGHQRISMGNITNQLVPVPPVSEQNEIVRRVEALFRLADAIDKRVAAATARAAKLMQAILAKAFRGELVPTEAELARREGRDYEPASALLERIRAERVSGELPGQPAKGRPRRRGTS